MGHGGGGDDFREPVLIVAGWNVPPMLAHLAPVLKCSEDVAEQRPRVAYLCRRHALREAEKADPANIERGVVQFKQTLKNRCDEDEGSTLEARVRNSDKGELEHFIMEYAELCNLHADGLQQHSAKDRAQLRELHGTTSVLFEVLTSVAEEVGQRVPSEIVEMGHKIAARDPSLRPFNILPLDPLAPGSQETFKMLPEIKAAMLALRNTNGMQYPGAVESKLNSEWDHFDFLQALFGFQIDNIRNQREAVILQLAAAHLRLKDGPKTQSELDPLAIIQVADRVFENYRGWCKYHTKKPSVPPSTPENAQLLTVQIALWLSIWGEAANIRFMPECLAYIFHFLAAECAEVVKGTKKPDANVSRVFLRDVIQPLYDIVRASALKNSAGHCPNENWNNYDDFNEFFWTSQCFKLGWPLVEPKAAFESQDSFFSGQIPMSALPISAKSKKKKVADAVEPAELSELNAKKVVPTRLQKVYANCGKQLFIEKRSWFQIVRVFDRLVIFHVMAFQAMIFIGVREYPLGDNRTIHKILTVFITAAIFRVIQAIGDIWAHWGILLRVPKTWLLRLWLKLVASFAWLGALGYTFMNTKDADQLKMINLYRLACAAYLAPTLLTAVVTLAPGMARRMESSDNILLTAIWWWAKPRSYIGRGMQEKFSTVCKYVLFWLCAFTVKFAFSYRYQVLPLIGNSRPLWDTCIHYETWDIFPGCRNYLGHAALWGPIALVYFLDMTVWYFVISALTGGLVGARGRHHEIRTFSVVRQRFNTLPAKLQEKLIPNDLLKTAADNGPMTPLPRFESLTAAAMSQAIDEVNAESKAEGSKDAAAKGKKRRTSAASKKETLEAIPESRLKVTETPPTEYLRSAIFAQVWNDVISSMREEDIISNQEMLMLQVPYASGIMPVIQWPVFLLAGKINSAVQHAAHHKGEDRELWEQLSQDELMRCAVIEAYNALRILLKALVSGQAELRVLQALFDIIDNSVADGTFMSTCQTGMVPKLLHKVVELVKLISGPAKHDKQPDVVQKMQDVYEVLLHDLISTKIREDLQKSGVLNGANGMELWACADPLPEIEYPPKDLTPFLEQAKRLYVLLTAVPGNANEPSNDEARRRIIWFTNSLFMDMPSPPPVRKMVPFTTLTPMHKEEIIYTMSQLKKENEEGLSIIFYLQNVYPDEWQNFLERTKMDEDEAWSKNKGMELRLWASCRGQTLARTVRGMMYYVRALELQAFFDLASQVELSKGFPAFKGANAGSVQADKWQTIQAIIRTKFTHVVSCQTYGQEKRTADPRVADIHELLKRYPFLRVAYEDEVPLPAYNSVGKHLKKVYSVLMKWENGKEEEVYRVQLPGPMRIGEGKPENQNHALIFTRGDGVQAIDMNQDCNLEEAFKMRNLLEELDITAGRGRDGPHRAVIGFREYIFTGSVSSLAYFMSLQEMSFVTLAQRVMATPLRVRMHYGHPDIFDRLFSITRGGMSKGSKGINVSEDVFAGFNMTLRGGTITHHEYIQVGKGRDVGFDQLAKFEAKVACGLGEQVTTRDMYRLAHRFDFFRMLSYYYTGVGFYINSTLLIIVLYALLYSRLLLAMTGLEEELYLQNQKIVTSQSAEWLLQISMLTTMPMLVELSLAKGFFQAIIEFIQLQFQLSSLYFSFHIGTKMHYFGRTLNHGGAMYRGTGRGFSVKHISFAEIYRTYSRSHFVKAFEFIFLLILYRVWGEVSGYGLVTFAVWLMSVSWLLAPFIFNPSGFVWARVVEDYRDALKWMNTPGTLGHDSNTSWEVWWEEEQELLETTSWSGRVLEVFMNLRWFWLQYGLVYRMQVATAGSNRWIVYAESWAAILIFLCLCKILASVGKGGADDKVDDKSGEVRSRKSNWVRIWKVVAFLASIGIIVYVSLVWEKFSDLVIMLLVLCTTSWGLLNTLIALRPIVKWAGLWDSLRELAKGYEYFMLLITFMPVGILAWIPSFAVLQTQILYSHALNRGVMISKVFDLYGRHKDKPKE